MRFYGKLFLFFFLLCVVFIVLVLVVTLSPRGAPSYTWPIDDPRDWFQNFVWTPLTLNAPPGSPQTYYVFALPLSVPVFLSIMFGHWLAIKYFQNN